MIINRQRQVRVSTAPLEMFLGRLRNLLHLPDESLSVCLVSDAAIARWNHDYRGKQGPTDVLSFPMNGNLANKGIPKRQRKQRLLNRQSDRAVRSSAEFFPQGISNSADYLGDVAISPVVARRNAHRSGRTLPQELQILVLHGVLHLMGYDHETDDGEMTRREQGLRRQMGLT